MLKTFHWESNFNFAYGLHIELPRLWIRCGIMCPWKGEPPAWRWHSKASYGLGCKDIWQLSIDTFAICIRRAF